jgi:hypothetical protein
LADLGVNYGNKKYNMHFKGLGSHHLLKTLNTQILADNVGFKRSDGFGD